MKKLFFSLALFMAFQLLFAQDNKMQFSMDNRQYTDMNGFQSEKPNGLLQQEFVIAIEKNGDMKKVGFFKGARFNLLFNRIDKTNDSLNYPIGFQLASNNINLYTAPFMTTMDIFKYSNTQFGINIPIIYYRPDSNSSISLNYGFSIIRDRPYFSDTIKVGVDSGKSPSDLRSTYSFANKIELEYHNTFTSDNKAQFGVYAKLGVMFISLKDSYYKQFDAAAIDLYDKITGLASIKSGPGGAKPIWYASFGLEKAIAENDAANVFFRLNYYYQTGNYLRAASSNVSRGTSDFTNQKFYNHYMQIQAGVTISIDQLFGASPKAADNTAKQVKSALL